MEYFICIYPYDIQLNYFIDMPCGLRFIPDKDHNLSDNHMTYFYRLEVDDMIFNSNNEHRQTRLFDEICWNSNWIKCDRKMVYHHLLERVMRQ